MLYVVAALIAVLIGTVAGACRLVLRAVAAQGDAQAEVAARNTDQVCDSLRLFRAEAHLDSETSLIVLGDALSELNRMTAEKLDQIHADTENAVIYAPPLTGQRKISLP